MFWRKKPALEPVIVQPVVAKKPLTAREEQAKWNARLAEIRRRSFEFAPAWR